VFGSHRELLGVLVLLALVAAVSVRLRRHPRRTALAALALAGAFVFFVIAGLGRSALGTATTSTRYVYEAIALGLPALGLALDMVAAAVRRIRPSSRVLAATAVVLIGVLVLWTGLTNVRQLRHGVRLQALGSLHLRQQLDATAVMINSGQAFFPDARTAAGSPYLSAEQLAVMVRAGWFPPPKPVNRELALRQRAGMQVGLNPRRVPPAAFGPRSGTVAGARLTRPGRCDALTPPPAGRPVILLPAGAPASFTFSPDAVGTVFVRLSDPGRSAPAGDVASAGGWRAHVPGRHAAHRPRRPRVPAARYGEHRVRPHPCSRGRRDPLTPQDPRGGPTRGPLGAERALPLQLGRADEREDVAGRGPRRRPSCRKWPAPVITGWSRPRAPARAVRRIGAIPPVIGSPSLNATSSGVVAVVSAAHAARLAAVAGSSGAVGTSSGIARGPAW
jgi:hypothetical protein